MTVEEAPGPIDLNREDWIRDACMLQGVVSNLISEISTLKERLSAKQGEVQEVRERLIELEVEGRFYLIAGGNIQEFFVEDLK